MSQFTRLFWALVVVVLSAGAAQAQMLGTFRWQLQPFCNVVVANVVQQQSAVYTLDGYDDQCGGTAPRAPLAGVATLDPDGSIGFGLNIVTTPGGDPVHVRATISLSGLSGTWRDSAGNTGSLAFNGAAAGSPRPAPAGLTVSAINVVGSGAVAGELTAGSVTAGGDASLGGNLTASGSASISGNVNARNIFANGGLIGLKTFGTMGGGGQIEFLSGRLVGTTESTPLSGDGLGSVNFAGITVPGIGGRRSGATIRSTTTQSWSPAASGASLTFSTNPNGSNAVVARLFIDHNGEVGIGTLTPDQLLSVNGGASKVGGGSWSVFSDERLKTVRGAFSRGLDALARLEPIRFEYRSDNALGLKAGSEHVGFSAQAVQRVIPEAVSTADNGYLRLDADPILWTMLNAVKELKSENDDLKRRLTALEAALQDKQR